MSSAFPKDILCLDTDPRTVAALKSASHNVAAVQFGYGTGVRYLGTAPQDFDLIVCDLRTPARFDRDAWARGNDNYKCHVVPQNEVTEEKRYISRGYGGALDEEHRYKLIYESQIDKMNIGSPFGPNDIGQAISLGGVPALMFLNPEWVLPADGAFVESFGIRCETAATSANKIKVHDLLANLSATWEETLEITLPVRCKITSGPTIPRRVQQKSFMQSQPIVSDRIGTVLGQFTRYGEGAIWLLPATTDNALTVRAFADGL